MASLPRFIAGSAGICLSALFLSHLFSPQVAAQTDPAEIARREQLRQLERERVLREQQEQEAAVRLEAPLSAEGQGRIPDAESPCFEIRRISLAGEKADHFQWALEAAGQASDGAPDPAIGRCLGAVGVNLVMNRIQNAVIAKGYVTTRILAEPQDLRAGVLKLTVVPGRIRSIRTAPGTDGRATLLNAMPARPGDLLNLRDLEQGLENLKRVPSAEADLQIAPADGEGAQPGESDVVVQWRQGFPLRLHMGVDDGGTEATGKYQGSLTVSYDHWWTLNDLFYVSHTRDLGGDEPGAHGSQATTVHYSVPFGYWLLGLTASSSDYHQSVAGANQTYMYSGETSNGEVRLSRLVYRDAVRKTTISMSAWKRTSRNFIDDTEVEVQRRRMAGWELGVAHREFVGQATVDLGLNTRKGTGMLGSLPAPEELFGEGTSRGRLTTATARATVPFNVGDQRMRYQATWRAQWNQTPLVPQDRFSIGGRYTVRGFDGERVLSAERGWLLRNDLSFALRDVPAELYLALDHGEVGGPSTGLLAGESLTGAALGVRGEFLGAAFDVFIGTPLSKPNGFQTSGAAGGFSLGWSY